MIRVVKYLALMSIGVSALCGMTAAYADPAQGNVRETPRNFGYNLKDGKRVPKADRVTNADGSWREEVRKGGCVEIKEGTPDGSVTTRRQCD